MKNSLFTSIVGLLLFTCAGCCPDGHAESDEAKSTAAILAKVMPASLAFKDRNSAEQTLSALKTSKHVIFGTALDAQKNVFASYFQPDQISQKEKLLARVTQSLTNGTFETLITDGGVVIAIAPMEINGQIAGYVAIGNKRH